MRAFAIHSMVCAAFAIDDSVEHLTMLQVKAALQPSSKIGRGVRNLTEVYAFPVPDDLEIVDESDPAFDSLKQSAEKYALKQDPGAGGIVDYVIVRSATPQKLHRVWGGPAKRCGFWWTLSHPLAISPSGNLTLSAFMSACGVCPEWNSGTTLETCWSKPGWSFIVGQGNSATCQNNKTLFPPAALLSVNGDVCDSSIHCDSCDLSREPAKCFDLLQAL